MSIVLLESLNAWWPEAILSFGALVVLLLGVWTKRSQPAHAVAWLTLASAALALTQVPVPPDTDVFFGMILCDPFSRIIRWLVLAVLAVVLLLIVGSNDVEESVCGEYFGLLFLIGVGLMLMAEANHLLMVYVAMELVSLSSYALVGFVKDARSSEAALKYLLFGALASGIMLFGMSLLFGLTGALSFPAIQAAVEGLDPAQTPTLLIAITLILVGLGFKVSMVPFHMWTPDAYEGAPIPVTALLSVGPKAAGLALLVRFMETLAPVWASLEGMLIILTIVTMTLGNLVALVQQNVKRLLAYSTIGQVGYLLMGFVVQTRFGLEGMLYYLFAYVFMNLGAFACVIAVVNDSGSESIEAFRGLSKRAPLLALLCTVCLLSLAGIPPLMGFVGKFLVFGAAIEAGYIVLAVAGVINSAIALYYYVNIIRLMYLQVPADVQPLWTSLPLRLATSICGVTTVLLGVFPNTLLVLIGASSFVTLL